MKLKKNIESAKHNKREQRIEIEKKLKIARQQLEDKDFYRKETDIQQYDYDLKVF